MKNIGYTGIHNSLFDILVNEKFTTQEYKILLLLQRKIHGWNKAKPYLTMYQIQKEIGGNFKRIRLHLLNLEKRNLIKLKQIDGVYRVYTIQSVYCTDRICTKCNPYCTDRICQKDQTVYYTQRTSPTATSDSEDRNKLLNKYKINSINKGEKNEELVPSIFERTDLGYDSDQKEIFGDFYKFRNFFPKDLKTEDEVDDFFIKKILGTIKKHFPGYALSPAKPDYDKLFEEYAKIRKET